MVKDVDPTTNEIKVTNIILVSRRIESVSTSGFLDNGYLDKNTFLLERVGISIDNKTPVTYLQ